MLRKSAFPHRSTVKFANAGGATGNIIDVLVQSPTDWNFDFFVNAGRSRTTRRRTLFHKQATPDSTSAHDAIEGTPSLACVVRARRELPTTYERKRVEMWPHVVTSNTTCTVDLTSGHTVGSSQLPHHGCEHVWSRSRHAQRVCTQERPEVTR